MAKTQEAWRPQIDELIQSYPDIDSMGFVIDGLANAGIGLSFVQEDNSPYLIFVDPKNKSDNQPVSLNRVLKDSYLDGLGNCVGFTPKNEDESEEEYLARVEWASERISEENGVEVSILPITKAWIDELASILGGEDEEDDSYLNIENAGDKEKVRFLKELKKYLKKELAPHGIEIISAAELIGAVEGRELPDLFLVRKNGGGSIKFANTDLWGWRAPGVFNKEYGTKLPYRNVCAIKVFDDGVGIKERKKITRRVDTDTKLALGNYYPVGVVVSDETAASYSHKPTFTVVGVDKKLMNYWKSNGGPVPTENEVVEHYSQMDVKKQVDYGFPDVLMVGEPPTVSLVSFRNGLGASNLNHRIGSYSNTLVVDYGSVKRAVLVDWGWNFSAWQALNTLNFQLGYENGIYPFLRDGLTDVVPRLYREDLLINSLSEHVVGRVNQLAQHDWNGRMTAEELVVLDLYHRLGKEELFRLCQEKMPLFFKEITDDKAKYGLFLDHLEKRHIEYYKKRKTYFDGLAITHGHWDHHIMFALMRDEIKRVGSEETRILGLADHFLSSTWYAQDVIARRMRESPPIKGNTLPVLEYPYLSLEEGVPMEVGPNIFITGYYTDHSIPGAMSLVAEVVHQKKKIASVLFGGDYKTGKGFEKVAKHHKGINLAVIEGTNPGSSNKASAEIMEEDVPRVFAQHLMRANNEKKKVVVSIVKNSYTRLTALIEETIKNGRIPVVSPRLAARCDINSLHLISDGSKKGKYVYLGKDENMQIPNLQAFGVKVWRRPGKLAKRLEKKTLEDYPVVSNDMMSASPEKYVLLYESSENPQKFLSQGSNGLWLWSAYGVYTDVAEEEMRYRQHLAEEHGWEFITKGLHASGHTKVRKKSDPKSKGSALDVLDEKVKPEWLEIQHTEFPVEINDTVNTYPNLRGRARYKVEEKGVPNVRIIYKPKNKLN